MSFIVKKQRWLCWLCHWHLIEELKAQLLMTKRKKHTLDASSKSVVSQHRLIHSNILGFIKRIVSGRYTSWLIPYQGYPFEEWSHSTIVRANLMTLCFLPPKVQSIFRVSIHIMNGKSQSVRLLRMSGTSVSPHPTKDVSTKDRLAVVR